MDKKRDPFAVAVIAELGGPAKTARLFKISTPSVTNWKIKGIPPARLMYLDVAQPAVLAKVRARLKKEKDISPVAASDDVQPPVGSASKDSKNRRGNEK